MEENIIQANEKERQTYTNILKSYSNRTRVSYPDGRKRSRVPNKSVFRICQLCAKYPEEEVLFLYNAHSPHDPLETTFQKSGEESLLIPNYNGHHNTGLRQLNPVFLLYLLFNVFLLIYVALLSIKLIYLYHFWLNVRISRIIIALIYRSGFQLLSPSPLS